MSFSLSLLLAFEERFDPDRCADACRVDIHQNGHNELPTTSGLPRSISVRSGGDSLVVFTSAISSTLAPYSSTHALCDRLASIGICICGMKRGLCDFLPFSFFYCKTCCTTLKSRRSVECQVIMVQTRDARLNSHFGIRT